MQHHGRFRIVNEIVEEAQGLRVRPERGKRLGFAGFTAFVAREKIHPQSAFGGIARYTPAIDEVWHGTEGLVDFLEYLKHRWGAVLDRDRHVLELGDVDVAGLERAYG